jgi:hypothetical protein
MSIALIDLILTAAAALFAGLWCGERGRRKAAEHWRVYGAPDVVPSVPGPAVESLRPPGPGTPEFEEAIDRGAQRLEAQAPDGYHLTRDEWREQARSMLREALAR